MKRLQNPASSVRNRGTVAPAGVTLSEVLVSMLIMSVGVVSLATLFPISVLRTAQATQLTHSVFLRNNAEAAVESNLGLLSNAQLAAPIITDSTQPTGITYGVIDPLGGFLVTPALPNFGGIANRPRISGGVTTLTQAEQLAVLPDSWSFVSEEPVTATNLPGSPPTITVANSTAGLNVRNGSTANAPNALHRMIMFDATGRLAVLQPLYQVTGQNLSWWNVNGAGTSLTTGPTLPANFTPTRLRIEVRDRRYTWLMTARKRWVPSIALVYGSDGAPGVLGTDDDGNGTTDWTNPPTNTIPDAAEIRYPGSDDDGNWAAELDVAVFYNRSFRAADETAFTLTYPVSLNVAGSLTAGGWTGFDGLPGVSGVDDDNNGSTDINPGESGFPGSDDNRTVIVTYVAGSKPYLKKGSYMLEPSQLKWYRIVDLKEASTTTTVLLLDQNLRYPPTTAATVPGVTGIFMRGIVEVFSLGSRTGQQ